MKVSKLFSVVALSCGVAFASSAAIAGTVSTDGSTSMEKVIGILSELLPQCSS